MSKRARNYVLGVRLGRPATRRAQIVTYCEQHWPCPIMQVARETGAERSHLKRVLRAEGYIEKNHAGDFNPMHKAH